VDEPAAESLLVLQTQGLMALAAGNSRDQLESDLGVMEQVKRAQLEHMMCTGQRWSPETFAALSAHPLCRPLLERVAWCVYDTHGRILGRAHPGQRVVPTRPQQGLWIGVPHPLELEKRVRQAWLATLPGTLFPQLCRPVFTLAERERGAIALDRYQGAEVEVGRLFARLRWGWSWHPVSRGGVLRGIQFPVPGEPGVVAAIQLLPGIRRGKVKTQRLGRVTIRRGTQDVTLGSLSPLGLSELVYAVDSLVATAVSDRC